MKNKLFAGKSTRTKIFTVITAVAIVLLLALNIFITSFGIFGNAYIDLTPEGLYTLRPIMVDACREIFYTDDGSLRDPGIKITFCDDPDNLISNRMTRIVYYMAVALSKKFDNCTVETVNVTMNPTAVAQYKTTSLTSITPTDVIVSYGSRYSINSAASFWQIGSDNKVYSYDGEYKMASVLLSLTLVDRPVAYFVTDHGETYYDVSNPENPMNGETGAFADLLRERGFEIKNLALSALAEEAKAQSIASGKRVDPSIPEDCVLLIINNPKTDFVSDSNEFDSFFYVSETEMLDRYMTEDRGAIMVAMDYAAQLPNFEDFLAEWGIECTDRLVKDSVNFVENEDDTETTIIADYELSEQTYAYNIYGDFAKITSSPRVVVGNTGAIISAYGDSVGKTESGSLKSSRIFAPFLYSSVNAETYAKDEITGQYTNIDDRGKQIIAAVGGRQTINSTTGEYTYSYIFCAASPDFLTTEYIGNASYANYDVISALVQNIARLETHADSALGGLSMNNDDDSFGGKMLVDTSIREKDEYVKGWDENGNQVILSTTKGLTKSALTVYVIIVAVIPLAIGVTGVIICLRRKYL